MVLRWLAGVAGVVVIVGIAQALIGELLVPRPVSSPFVRVTRLVTQLVITTVARTGWSFGRQHRFLSALGPLIVVATLLIAVAGFLLGFSLLVYAVTGTSISSAALQAGSGLMTLGIIDENGGPLLIGIVLLAAFTGMVIIAVLVGYLIFLFTDYTDRETGVTKSSVMSGEPAWGAELLCRRRLADVGTLDPVGDGWIDWVCSVRVAQTMYPILAYFRSSGPMRSWVTTLIARMDAAALELTVARHHRPGDLTSLLAEGSQTLAVMRVLMENGRAVITSDDLEQPTPGHLTGSRGSALYRAIRTDGQVTRQHRLREDPATGPSTLTREEFDHAVGQMRIVGIPLVEDLDEAWHRFRWLRGEYESDAYRVASRIQAPPAPWTGSRRRPLETVWPTSCADLYQASRT